MSYTKSILLLLLLTVFLSVNGNSLSEIGEQLEQIRNDLQLLKSEHSETVSQAPSGTDRCMTGPPGPPGRDGHHGPAGLDGRDGLTVVGPPGEAGTPGVDGKDGATGAPGRDAVPCRPPGSAIYTRWGRTVCGDNSSVVYEGFAANGRFDNSGNGNNFQCMPVDPEPNRTSREHGNGYAVTGMMAGTEYKSFTSGIFPHEAHDQNVPCAVCSADERPSVLMIPAKRTCPNGWLQEYEGYLMASHRDHKMGSTFECVDAEPEYIENSEATVNGALLYFIRPDCDKGMPCPQYVANEELTCVVCTK